LLTILEFVQPGDTVCAVKLGRLGCSTRDVLNLVHDLEQKGVHLRVLEPAINTGDQTGKMVLTVLGMVAEMELTFIKERQKAGIEAAKAKGIYKGRPVTLDHARIREMRAAGEGATKIARALGCTPAAVYKVLSQA
jgi:DNA invertase Pin-like site-specific DNA recombinase